MTMSQTTNFVGTTVQKRPKIAFIASGDPRDRDKLSGTPYCMIQALQKNVGDVVVIHPEGMSALILKLVELPLKVIDKVLYRTMGKRFDAPRSILLSLLYGFVYGIMLKKSDANVVFCAIAGPRIAFLKTKLPIIFLSDATFAAMIDYYPQFTHLLAISRWRGNFVTTRAINKASALIYSSDWAADSAIKYYHADRNIINVIPFGANLDENIIPDLNTILNKSRSDKCRLLFIGKNWIRKGGAIAYETLLQLKKSGIPSRLTVVGCVPPVECNDSDFVIVPYLDKKDPDQRKKFYDLYMDADFFIFPTRAECSPIVSCESSAFGLPVLATDTGGVKSYIKDGINGYCLPYSAKGREYAELIENLYRDTDKYRSMVISTYHEYQTRLNWDVWGISLKNVFVQMGFLQ